MGVEAVDAGKGSGVSGTREDRTVAVLNLPTVRDPGMNDKLKAVIKKQINEIITKNGGSASLKNYELTVCGEEGMGFITFSRIWEAKWLRGVMDGFALDPKHKFSCWIMRDLDGYMEHGIMPVGRTERVVAEPQVVEARYGWYFDQNKGEQVVMMTNTKIKVDAYNRYELGMETLWSSRTAAGDWSTVTEVRWSNQGMFLCVHVPHAIRLFCGTSLTFVGEITHYEMAAWAISPKDGYIITWDGSPAKESASDSLRIWNIADGSLVYKLGTPARSITANQYDIPIRFSHDDSYFAYLDQTDMMVIDMRTLDMATDGSGLRRPLSCPYIAKLQWSPGDNIIAMWNEAQVDKPGRVILYDVENGKEANTRAVYNAVEASLDWQPKGDFLCLRTLVRKKLKKKAKPKDSVQLEVFRMREKMIPTDNIQIEGIKAHQLHWEGGISARFALIVRDDATSVQSIRFYKVDTSSARGNTHPIASMPISSDMNFMAWNPLGSFFILAALGASQIDFCVLNENDSAHVIKNEVFDGTSELRWSNCGRYVSSCKLATGQDTAHAYGNTGEVELDLGGEEGMEGPADPDADSDEDTSGNSGPLQQTAGYAIWNMHGRQLCGTKLKSLACLAWRTHPQGSLDAKTIRENIKMTDEKLKEYEDREEREKRPLKEKYDREQREGKQFLDDLIRNTMAWKQQHPKYAIWENAWEEYKSKITFVEKDVSVYQAMLQEED